jgi:putative FmdB family regulatory protein
MAVGTARDRRSKCWKPDGGGDYFPLRFVSRPLGFPAPDAAMVHARRRRRMPTYDYACQKCGHAFQRIEKISEHGLKKVKCPECKSTRVERVFTSVFVKTSRKN